MPAPNPHRKTAITALIVLLPLTVLTVLGTAPAQEAKPRDPSSELAPDELPMSAAATRGRVVYENHCIGCHGPEGRGDGPAAEFLSPVPRNFQSGRFKFRSTPMGSLPTRADLFHTITCGLQGSSMPEFRLVSEPERRDVVEYVLHLAAFGLVRQEAAYLVAEEGRTLAELRGEELEAIYADVVAEKITRARPVAVPRVPERSAELIAAGEKVYKLQCAACHGATGKGDGNSARTLRDWKDSVIVPRDFTSGVFRAGSASTDIYTRLRTGLTGTPMPAIGASDDELWSLVFYMETLIDPDAKKPNLPAGCGGEVQR